MDLKIAGREPNSIVDGEGLRYVIFFQGCNHFCKNCHNKETWNYNNGLNSSIEEEIQLIAKHINYIDGITISGGDPFFQYENLLNLCKAIKQTYNLNIWVYTGYTIEEIKTTPPLNNDGWSIEHTLENQHENMNEVLDYIDVLVDGKYIEELKSPHLPFVGSSNQKIIKLR